MIPGGNKQYRTVNAPTCTSIYSSQKTIESYKNTCRFMQELGEEQSKDSMIVITYRLFLQAVVFFAQNDGLAQVETENEDVKRIRY